MDGQLMTKTCVQIGGYRVSGTDRPPPLSVILPGPACRPARRLGATDRLSAAGAAARRSAGAVLAAAWFAC